MPKMKNRFGTAAAMHSDRLQSHSGIMTKHGTAIVLGDEAERQKDVHAYLGQQQGQVADAGLLKQRVATRCNCVWQLFSNARWATKRKQ